MKNIGIFCLLLACIGLESCKKNQDKQVIEDAQEQTEKSTNEMCYKALYQKDTIDLKINTLKNEKITGSLVMNVFKEPRMSGEIAGEFHGDTLICSYTFILGTNKKITYKNPMAFLKKGDLLILGNGKIENNMGGTYFVTPVDFDHVKYRFSNVDCIDKN